MKNGEQSIHIITDSINNEYISGGLTKREYFAAMALQGICANSAFRSNTASIVEVSVSLADELLK